MIKKRIIPLLLLCITLVIFSCATNSIQSPEQKEETTITSPEIEKEPVEPEDPPNVKFAKQLREFLDSGDIIAAINHFNNLPDELSDDIDLQFILGALYYSNQQYDDAISIAQKIIDKDPLNIDALELITLSKHAKGDTKASKEEADKILAVDPYNATVNIQRAEEYVLNKKYKLAKDSYKKALKGNDFEDRLRRIWGRSLLPRGAPCCHGFHDKGRSL